LVASYLEMHQIDLTLLPPALLGAMPAKKLPHLKTLVVGGETCPKEIMQSWGQGRTLINAYGPTEISVCATMHKFEAGDSNTNIGKPLDNFKVYILDPYNTPVPIGVTGELHIAGAGLARGYLNRPDLTTERFVPNPFATAADLAKGYDRMYKTGDMVRWLPDGNIEYIGRNDDQVKIRGFRIELGEIESALNRVAGIRQSCVLARERKSESGNTKYLAAYYVPDNSIDVPDQSAIEASLSLVLPEYMIPAAWVEMEAFPLTINGKLDKRALPEPDFSLSPDLYTAPVTETETLLCTIWQEILGLQRVGVTDDFFRIGGNSILAIQVSHRMNRALNCEVKVADVFQHKTIAQLLFHSMGLSQISIPKTDADQAILSFAQQRLWFIEQYEQGTNAYHIPALLELDPTTQVEALKYALGQILLRHEVLRSTIEQTHRHEHALQIVHKKPLPVQQINLTQQDDYTDLIKQEINRPFDLSREYPVRVVFYSILPAGKETSECSPVKTLLLINIHHIFSRNNSNYVHCKKLEFRHSLDYKHDNTVLHATEYEYVLIPYV